MEIGESVKVAGGADGVHQDDAAERKKPLALRVVKVLGPAHVEACQMARYRVVAYNRLATPEEKKRIRWEVRIAGETRAIADPAERQGSTLVFAKVPEEHAGVPWAGRKIRIYAYLDNPSEQASVETEIGCSGMCRYIALVKKVEAATGWDPETVLNALRRVAGYDTAPFQKLYGLTAARRIVATGKLSEKDIADLAAMSSHGGTGRESGIVRDLLGYDVAVGHVLTGLSAGQHRNREADLRPAWVVGAGSTLDNLYAATLAGDIGQSAFEFHIHPGGAAFGAGSELSHAEAVGDIDGLMMGDEGGLNGRTVSKRLHDYYCVHSNESPGSNAAHRFKRFAFYNDNNLLTESRRFAVNWVYHRQGVMHGLRDSIETEVDRVLAEFLEWLEASTETEQQMQQQADAKDRRDRAR